MKKELFRSFVEQVAEIKDLTPKKDPNIRLDDDVEDQVRIGDDWVHLNSKSNPTLGFKVVKLKEQHKICELGCGDVVTDQIIERRLAFSPQKHWRTRCSNCGCYVSPDGKGFIEGSHQVHSAYLKHFNGLKGIETPETVIKIDRTNNNQEYEEIITNDSVIRRYK